MRRPTHFFISILFTLLPLSQIFSQKKIVIDVLPQDSLVTYRLTDLDVIYGLAGDTVTGHPYYTFLWLFGDGSFVNGTRDSVISHVYALGEKQLYHQNGPSSSADVVAYAIGNYSGGTRPPRSPMAPPGDPFRSPSISEGSFNLAALGSPDATPAPIDTSVIDTSKTDFLRLQFSTEVRPQDTMVGILSFRQPAKLPVQPIRGQLFVFFNSEIETENIVQVKAQSLFKNALPALSSPSLSHGRTKYVRPHVHFTNTAEVGDRILAADGITGFNDVVVFEYDSLSPDGLDERHLFLEMANDSVMWELFKDGQKSSLNFMAVMTALEFDPDVLGPLPNVVVPDTAINNLLVSTIFDDNAFVPLGPNDPEPQVIAIEEVNSDIVSAHDPNALTLYACECPDTIRKKVVGVIDFSNDGAAPTTQVSVELKIPNQLNINSLENIELSPSPAFAVAPSINFVERTATWTWSALLQPAESAGMGDPSTKGQIVFALTLKEGEDVGTLDPSDACITFDFNTPMCTLPVTSAEVVLTNTGDVSGDLLECIKCEEYTSETDSPTGIDWWCAMLWALGIIILVLVVAFLRRFIA